MRSFAGVLVLSVALTACQSEGKPPVAPAAPPKPVSAPPKPPDITAQDYVMPALPHARVTFTDAKGAKVVVDAEVAATGPARTRGLMWRTVLPEGTGMLFIFPEEDYLSFWMKNTLIPLDMIFIAKDRSVVNVEARAEPKTLSPRPAKGPALYVLEVPGGWSEKIGVKPGAKVQLEGIDAIVPTH